MFGWNALEVLAFTTGNPARPMNAIPPVAKATLQLRFVVGTDPDAVLAAVRAHLDGNGLRRGRGPCRARGDHGGDAARS